MSVQTRVPKRSSQKQKLFLSIVRSSAICHPERSIAIGLTNRRAQSSDPLWAIAMKDHCCSVYMIASKSRVIYIGMTNDLTLNVRTGSWRDSQNSTAAIAWGITNLSTTQPRQSTARSS